MTQFTRRQATGVLIAGAATPLLPNGATAEPAESLAKKLAEALNNRLVANAQGRFSVNEFRLDGTHKNVVMRATVQLDWPPGTRRRPFRSFGTSQQDAIAAMFQNCLSEFGGAWPEGVRV